MFIDLSDLELRALGKFAFGALPQSGPADAGAWQPIVMEDSSELYRDGAIAPDVLERIGRGFAGELAQLATLSQEEQNVLYRLSVRRRDGQVYLQMVKVGVPGARSERGVACEVVVRPRWQPGIAAASGFVGLLGAGVAALVAGWSEVAMVLFVLLLVGLVLAMTRAALGGREEQGVLVARS